MMRWEWFVIYIGIGLVFAILRTVWAGYSVRQEYLTFSDPDNAKYYLNRQLDDLKGNVTRWMSQWVISLPYWILVDLCGEFFSRLYDYLTSVFTYLFEYRIGSKK